MGTLYDFPIESYFVNPSAIRLSSLLKCLFTSFLVLQNFRQCIWSVSKFRVLPARSRKSSLLYNGFSHFTLPENLLYKLDLHV